MLTWRSAITGWVALACLAMTVPANGEDGRPRESRWRRDAPMQRRPRLEDDGSRSHGRQAGHMDMLIERMSGDAQLREELGITDEQIETLRDAAYAVNQQRIDLRARLEKKALEQARMMMAPEIDEQALMQRVEETGAVRTELAKLRMKQLILAKRTLTREQIRGLRTTIRQSYRKRRGAEDAEEEVSEERRRPRHPRGDTRSSVPQE